MAQLWAREDTADKSGATDGLLERFTVGEDRQLDARLAAADCVGSLAQVEMLTAMAILTPQEHDELRAALLALLAECERGQFSLQADDEDCHTAIENRLVAMCGAAGKRIHTGRSRNDQALTALRLFGRAFLLRLRVAVGELIAALLECAGRYEQLFMVGRTHLQPAMPSSVGLWAAAHAEQLLDDMTPVEAIYRLIDRSPLGSAAGYGTPLALDRQLIARLLGFGDLHHTVLGAANARGRSEGLLLDLFHQVGLTLSRLAQDLILFSLPEFGYFALPAAFSTGSSIMPQKRNPDVLELVRARAGLLSGYSQQAAAIIRALPSGYNRDVQEIKGAFLRGCDTLYDCVRVMGRAIEGLKVFPERLRAAPKEIFAADEALRRAEAGEAFRDAYRAVARDLDSLTIPDLQETLARRSSIGAPGNLGLEALHSRCAQQLEATERAAAIVRSALIALVGYEPQLL